MHSQISPGRLGESWQRDGIGNDAKISVCLVMPLANRSVLWIIGDPLLIQHRYIPVVKQHRFAVDEIKRHAITAFNGLIEQSQLFLRVHHLLGA
jgi:hypothetical protein